MNDRATERRSGFDRRSDNDMRRGAERRAGVERRNGLAVLLAGCPKCGKIAPPPTEMHLEGWLIVADDQGVKLIACPEHRHLYESASGSYQLARVTPQRPHLGQDPDVDGEEQAEVLLVCVHHAGRSQMAAGLVKLRSQGRVQVRSAGSAPAEQVSAAAVEVMGELGVDLTGELPKLPTDDAVRAADVVITMGCRDACPISPGQRHEAWVVDDPPARTSRQSGGSETRSICASSS